MTTSRLRRRLLVCAVFGGVLAVGIAVPALLAVDRSDPAPPPPDLRALVTCTDVEVITVGQAGGRTPDEAIDQLMIYVGHPDLTKTARRETVYSTATARTITVTPPGVDHPTAAFAFETRQSGRLALTAWAKCWGYQP